MGPLPWTVTFARPSGAGPLQRHVANIVEMTLPLPLLQDSGPRVTIDRDSASTNDPGTVTLRLDEQELEILAEGFFQARRRHARVYP